MKKPAGLLSAILVGLLFLQSCTNGRTEAKISKAADSPIAETGKNAPDTTVPSLDKKKNEFIPLVKAPLRKRNNKVLASNLQVKIDKLENQDSSIVIYELNGFGATSK